MSGAKIPVAVGLGIVAVAMVIMSTCTETTGYGRVAIVLALIGIGLGMTMAPATDAIMTSLPPDKAGVGSAVNDANRLVGGALGVAVLGSVLSSAFSSDMESQTVGSQLPAGATEGIGQALNAAGQLPGAAGLALHDAAISAFVQSMGATFLLAAAVALAGAIVALVWLPGLAGRSRPRRPAGHSGRGSADKGASVSILVG